jgi:hypothetical protein
MLYVGLTKHIGNENGYSMNGEIKMLRKVLAETSSEIISDESASSVITLETGSDNKAVDDLSAEELRVANETIATLQRTINILNEDSELNREMEEQLCDLEEQLLKSNQSRVNGINQNSQLNVATL